MAINKNKVIAAAQKYVQKGQLDRAIREYYRVVEDDPTDVRTWLKIGDLQARKEAFEEATETYLRVANYYSEQGFFLKAVAVFKQVLKLKPGFVEVQFKLAALYKQLGLVTDSRRQLEAAYQILVKAGRMEESLQVLVAMVEIDPENVAARIRLAETYSKEKRVDEAVAEFAQAAEILRSTSRIDDFLRVSERLIWHRGDCISLIKEVASLYLERQDPRRALQKLQVCYKADEKDTETMGLLVNAFLALDQQEKAVTILKVLATVHEEKGELDQRDEVFRRILMLAPEDYDARDALREATGVSAVGAASDAHDPRSPLASHLEPQDKAPTRDQVPASEDQLPAQALDPEEEEGLEADGIEIIDDISDLEVLEEAGDGELAGQLATMYAEAEVFEKFGLMDESLAQLERARQLDPDSPDTQLRLKELYVKLGRISDAVAAILVVAGSKLAEEPNEATALLREALELDPKNRRVQEMLADIPGQRPKYRSKRSSINLASRWQLAESDAQIMDDIAAEAYAEEPIFATEEIDIDALERELEDAVHPASSPFRPILTESGAAPGVGDRFSDDGGNSLEIGLEYLEEQPEGEGMDSEGDLLLDPLLLGEDPSVSMDDDLEVNLSYLAGDQETGQRPVSARRSGDASWEEDSGDISMDLDFDRSDPGYDTAVVSADRLDRIAADLDAADDDEPLDLDRDPSDPGISSEDLFQDELRQLEEAEQLVASLTGDDLPQVERPIHVAVKDEGASDAYAMEEDFADLGTPAGSLASPGAAAPQAELEIPEALAEEMAEASFFIDQGLIEDAIGMLRELIEEHGEHPALMARIGELTAMLHDEGQAGDELDILGGDLDDALGHLSVPDDGGGDDLPRSARMNIPRREEDAFFQFKEGVAKQVGEDDADTHFDLGIAYREMGMLRDAIGEFKTAMRPTNEVQCHLMIAHCHRDLGEASEAIGVYKNALYCDPISDPEQVDIFYQMGKTYEGLEDPKEALYYFDKVSRMAQSYRDVEERRAALKAALDVPITSSQSAVDSAFDDLLGLPRPGQNGS